MESFYQSQIISVEDLVKLNIDPMIKTIISIISNNTIASKDLVPYIKKIAMILENFRIKTLLLPSKVH